MPIVDYRTLNIDTQENGDLTFSWAPEYYDRPLWYNLGIFTVADHNSDTFPDEVGGAWSLNRPHATISADSLPDEPLYLVIQIRDAGNGAMENNRSNSLRVGYAGPGFDYASLVDTDNDGWANNIDPDDNNPYVYPTMLDEDGDGVPDVIDNCLSLSNPDQRDANQNDIGDACDIDSDTDGDGLTDAQEYALGINPLLEDTDGDEVMDGEEVGCGANPLDGSSICNKGMPWLILLLDEQ